MSFTSPFQQISFDKESSLLVVVWQNTENLNNEIYQKEVLWQLDFILRFCPKNIIIDTQNFDFPIIPQLQEWSNEEIMPQVLATPVRKIALLVSQYIFSQVSIEQQMEDNPDALALIRYFDAYQKAQDWCLRD